MKTNMVPLVAVIWVSSVFLVACSQKYGQFSYTGVTAWTDASGSIPQKIEISEAFFAQQSLFMSNKNELLRLDRKSTPTEVMFFLESVNYPYKYTSSCKQSLLDHAIIEYEYISISVIPMMVTFKLGTLSEVDISLLNSSEKLKIGTDPNEMFSLSILSINDMEAMFGSTYLFRERYRSTWK